MSADGSVLQRDLPITNKRGLHARASAKFVQTVESFPETEVEVTKDNQTVCGTSIHVTTRGPRAAEAMAAIAHLVESRFHEE